MAGVLEERYASPEIAAIFSEKNKILLERGLWIKVMEIQKELGLIIPESEIEKYRLAKEHIDLNRISEIEKITKHDVKAGIEAFIEASGAGEHIHKGMTSRDLTDNVEQMQIRDASKIIIGKYAAILNAMLIKAEKYSDLVIPARTHNQPAQATTLGRRFAMWSEELLYHLEDFDRFMKNYPLRGIKGAIGTMSEMEKLLGSEDKAELLDKKVAEYFGFSKVMKATGQTYPRSFDLSLVSRLSELSSAVENFSITLRLMSGFETAAEGFSEGQVGSSAMPHKMNPRSSERIFSLCGILKGYSDMASRISGEQWNEGDVSCSALRREIIPNAFFVSDGICETSLYVLNNMKVYENNAKRESEKYGQFIASAELLSLALKNGIGREKAHEIIRNASISAEEEMRIYGKNPNLEATLSKDEEFIKAGITEEKIRETIIDAERYTGLAKKQIKEVIESAQPILEKYKKEREYKGKEIL